MASKSFDVIATLNKLRTDSILLGRPLGYRPNNKEWKRPICFWCGQSVVNAEHYLWNCPLATTTVARQELYPQTDTELERFVNLPGRDTAAKLRIYKKGVLRYEADKVCNYIEAMMSAEEERTQALREHAQKTGLRIGIDE